MVAVQSFVCECGWDRANGKSQALALHKRLHCPLRAQNVVEEPEVATVPQASQPRSERGRRRRSREMQMLSPLEQIRGKPSNIKGAWAYYINPEGATIRDALILYPNGARLSPQEDPRGKFSENADYFQARQRRKGLEYIGPTLTPEGVRRLVQVLQDNQEDEVLDLEDQIAECEHDIANSDRPEWRDNQRMRRDKLQRRLDYVRAGLDPDKLIEELDEIARAQRLSRVDPNILAVMREMLGEVTANFQATVEKFRSTAPGPDANDAVWNGKTNLE